MMPSMAPGDLILAHKARALTRGGSILRRPVPDPSHGEVCGLRMRTALSNVEAGADNSRFSRRSTTRSAVAAGSICTLIWTILLGTASGGQSQHACGTGSATAHPRSGRPERNSAAISRPRASVYTGRGRSDGPSTATIVRNMLSLSDALIVSILESIPAARSATSGGIGAYALVADAGMSSVYAASATKEFLRSQSDPELLFMPMDWPAEHHTAAFQRASEELALERERTIRDQNYRATVRAVVDTFAEALSVSRDRDSSLAGAFLLVAGLDGGESWADEEGRTIRKLNGPVAYDDWLAVVGTNKY